MEHGMMVKRRSWSVTGVVNQSIAATYVQLIIMKQNVHICLTVSQNKAKLYFQKRIMIGEEYECKEDNSYSTDFTIAGRYNWCYICSC